MKTILTVVFLSLFITPSKKNSSETSLLNEIRFYEEAVYAETGDVMFGNILTASVDPTGRVFLGDNDQGKVHVLESDGGYITSFGGKGNGPGEFQMIRKIAVDENHIHIFDLIQSRVHLFDTGSYRFVRTVTLAENGGGGMRQTGGPGRPFDMHLLPGGNYLVSYRNFMDSNANQIRIVSPGGESREITGLEFPDGSDEHVVQQSSGNRVVVANFPFSRTSLLAVSPKGLIYTNWNGKLSFNLFDDSGNRYGSFSHPFHNAPLNREEVIKTYEDSGGGTQVTIGSSAGGGMPQMSRMLQNMEMPDTWPAVSSLHADANNRLWVATFTEKPNERRWYLFDEEGSLLGNFTWPPTKSVVPADGESVYVLVRDPEELDEVIRYRVGF